MRTWFATAALAWVTAVLVTSPVLAARTCLECCSERAKPPATAAKCPRCPLEPRGTVSTETCHGCPKCESSRPSPAASTAPVDSWSPDELFAYVVDSLPPDVRLEGPVIVPSRGESARAAHPALQILYFTWLN